MTDWSTARLGDVCTVTAGGTPARAKREYFGGEIPWVKIGDMLQGVVTETQESITPLAVQNSAAKMLPAGTVLISIFATIGRTAVLGLPATTNQAIAGLTPHNPDVLSSTFLRRWLDSLVRSLEGRARGVAQVNINSGILRALEIPLPPLDEQRRIAAILDQADALRAKRRQALAHLDDLTQSVFLDMFGDPDSQTRWPVVPLSDIVADLQGGKSLVAADSAGTSVNRVLKISAVTRMYFQPDECKAVPDDYAPPPDHFVKQGDLLFSRANTTELVGALAYVWDTPPNLLLPDKLWRFVWKRHRDVEPLFIWALLQTKAVRRELSARSSGTGGSMKNISKAKLLPMQIPLPSHDLQARFALAVTAQERAKTQFRLQMSGLDFLFASLQARAFSGRL